VDREERNRGEKSKTSVKEYLGALWRYLQSPKTVFDLKDRIRALVYFAVVIIVLQTLVKRLHN